MLPEQLTGEVIRNYGPLAPFVFGLIWLAVSERKRAEKEQRRADDMTERMIEDRKNSLEDAARREAAMLNHLERISAFIRGREA